MELNCGSDENNLRHEIVANGFRGSLVDPSCCGQVEECKKKRGGGGGGGNQRVKIMCVDEKSMIVRRDNQTI